MHPHDLDEDLAGREDDQRGGTSSASLRNECRIKDRETSLVYVPDFGKFVKVVSNVSVQRAKALSKDT